MCALPNGLGRVSDVFISVWLVSGELAVWAALVRRYIDHSTMQTMRGEVFEGDAKHRGSELEQVVCLRV